MTETRLTTTDQFPLLHALALRGCLSELPGDANALVSAKLVVATPRGFTLTDAGHRLHRALAQRERESLDLGRLDVLYERFLLVDRGLRALSSRWQTLVAEERTAVIGDFDAIVRNAEPVLRASAEIAPRFLCYVPRLAAALEGLHAGDVNRALGSGVESVRTVFTEIHEDYLQLLGRSHEQEAFDAA